MTPQDKAKELVEKYKPYVYCYIGSGMLTDDYDEEVALINAKQSALVAVDEILGVLFQHHKIDYWQQVKQEIEKL